MPDLKSVWILSRDRTLPPGIPPGIKTVLTEKVDTLLGQSLAPSVIIFDPDDLSPEVRLEELIQLEVAHPNVPILVWSALEERESVMELIRSNIKGFLLKKESPNRFGEALREICQGGAPFSAEINTILLELVHNKPTIGNPFNLKDWEIEVLQQLSEGMTKKDISKKYHRSVHTIDNHVRMIYAKMNVNNLGAAVGEGFRAGIIS